MTLRFAALLAVAAATAAGQTLSVGIRGGMPLGSLSAASRGYSAETGRFTGGPAIEFRWMERVVVGVDLLYKRMSQSHAFDRADVHRFEVPVLIKYRWAARRVRPFAGLGMSLNRVVRVEGTQVAEMRHRGTKGFVAAAGIEKRTARVRIAPEFRVTHWVDRNFGVHDAPLRSNLNQAELLVGITF